MKSPYVFFTLLSYAKGLAQAYNSIIFVFLFDHSCCPRYDTRVKTYLDLSSDIN